MINNRMPQDLHAKDVDERDVLEFGFGAALMSAETVQSAVVTCEVRTGTDLNAAAVLDGAPTIDGARVLQAVTGGVAGVIYTFRARAVLSSGRELVLAAWLPVTRLGS